MQYSEGNIIDGRYLLIRRIGAGSFGEVWVARDNETELEVALKIYLSMDAQGLNDFKKEFQLSFDLNHTNLLHSNYLGTTAEDSRAYLVMPLCPDGSSTKYIGNIDEPTLWRFIKDVASGLAYLHDQHPPLIHQDIKPDNILISRNGDFLITDFGISKQLRNTLRRSVDSANVSGSLPYMGPERFSKQNMPIKASDIWSLGATIYELATGNLPFCAMGGGMQKNGAEIPDLEDFSPEMDMVMRSCLALETWDRPTAFQLEEYATKHLAGEKPSVTWHMPEKVQAEPASRQGFEEVPVQYDPGAGIRTVIMSIKEDDPDTISPDYVQTVKLNDSNPKPNPSAVYSSGAGAPAQVKEAEKGIAVWLWVVFPIVGLISGILLNLLPRIL